MSKIQNEQEVLAWFEEGRSYAWMREEYERKYNITTSNNMWAMFRRRRGLERRQVRNDDLIPWRVAPEHRWAYPVAMLRLEARVRAEAPITHVNAMRLASWKASLAERDLVVHYDGDTEEGFHLVPRRKDKDKDLIREPGTKTSKWLVPKEGKQPEAADEQKTA